MPKAYEPLVVKALEKAINAAKLYADAFADSMYVTELGLALQAQAMQVTEQIANWDNNNEHVLPELIRAEIEAYRRLYRQWEG